MARATFVKAARKAVPSAGIKVGDSYWWWKFRRGPKQLSKEKPRRSQLTQSAYYSRIWDLEDRVAECEASDAVAGLVEELQSELEDVKSDCESSLENMPENLQESSSSGEMLRERIEHLEGVIDELGSLDVSEFDRDTVELPEQDDGEDDDTFEGRCEQARDEAETAYWQEKLGELQGISISN